MHQLAGGPVASGLSSTLRAAIAAGTYRPGDFLPSVRKLSADYRLAHKTVYHALQGLAAEGWISAEHGRGHRVLSRSNDPDRGAPVAFVLTPQSPSGSAVWDNLRRSMLDSLQQAAAERGWMLLAVECEPVAAGGIVERLRDLKVCGAIVDSFSPDVLTAVRRLGVSTVAVDHWHENVDADSVVQDGFLGGYLAGSWLAGRSHRSVGWIGPKGWTRQGSERFGGASAALNESGAALPPEWQLALPETDVTERVRMVREYLSRPDRPRALLTLWQGISAVTAQAARELGLVPGRDFEMVGWSTEGDYQGEYRPNFAGGPVPPAVVWDVDRLARTAVARLAERRADPKSPPVMIKIPSRLRLAE
ncbi:MAG TPA: GntR family transcriptional regulator [Planctomycetota bacterium]|nr:GntR family transcriptional regulator [Planctomycetota bacterium]